MAEETPAEEDPQARAMRRAATLWAEDAHARELGLIIVEVAPGRAVVELTVTPTMTNGHGTAHGGLLFTLADAAFAFAANSRTQDHVAEHASVTFLRAVVVGERLRAEAVERHRYPRAAMVDVTVTDEAGDAVAEFRGHSRVPGGDGDAPSA